jgi:hypothetical protein
MKNRSIILAIIFLIIGGFLGGYVGLKYENNKDNAPVAFCATNDLKASVGFEGAAGNIFGTFTITNISNKKCQINGRNYITPNYDQNGNFNVSITNSGLPSVSAYELLPDQSVYASIHLPNGPQCSSSIKYVPVTYSYSIADSSSVAFSDSNNNKNFSISACQANKDITQVTITNLSDLTPNQ